MKRFGLAIAFWATLLGPLMSCENKQKQANSATEAAIPLELRPNLEKKPIMVFDAPSVYLGRIAQGDSLSHTFYFTNKGNLPLQLISVNASCGCTTPKWSKDRILPGKRGFIKVKFKSKGIQGAVSKTVTAYANTLPMENQVAFKVFVQP